MKKLPLIVGLIAALFFLPSFARAEDESKTSDDYDVDKIAAINSAQLSEGQFYGYEQAIISGFSGSGGYFLGKEEIEWLKKAITALEAKGIKLKDEYHRGVAFGDSYFHLKEYPQAIEEYKRAGELGGTEEVEWFLNNEGVKNGPLKIIEYPGKIPYASSEAAKTEDAKYLFVSYFKGPVYRYDKASNKHAVIYAPDRYEWVDFLDWDGEKLIIIERDGAGAFEFDNKTNTLIEKKESENSYYDPKVSSEVQSPDGKKIAFLKPSSRLFPLSLDQENPHTDLVRWPQLWIKDADGKNEKMLMDVGGIAYDPKRVSVIVCDVKGIIFSLDGKRIYFRRTEETAGSFANSWLYTIPADGSAPEKKIDPVASMKLIERGKYRGSFLVSQISNSFFKEEGWVDTRPGAQPGPYFIYGVMDPDGKVIKTLHETPGMDALSKEECAALKSKVEGMQ